MTAAERGDENSNSAASSRTDGAAPVCTMRLRTKASAFRSMGFKSEIVCFLNHVHTVYAAVYKSKPRALPDPVEWQWSRR